MKKRKKRAKKGEPQTITKAVAHIRLEATNPGKLTALDALAEVYLELTQQYTTLFCTDELPNSFRAPCFLTSLSERWHRVAIQHGASIAKSWRSNRANAYQDYLDALTEYQEQQADGTLVSTFTSKQPDPAPPSTPPTADQKTRKPKGHIGEPSPYRDQVGTVQQEGEATHCSFSGPIKLEAARWLESKVQEVQCSTCGSVSKAKLKEQSVVISPHPPRKSRPVRNVTRWMEQESDWVLVQKKE